MTESSYKTGSYKVDHTTYGGLISPFDFDGHHTMATMARKIMSDLNFDKQCKRNIEQKHKANKYKKERKED